MNRNEILMLLLDLIEGAGSISHGDEWSREESVDYTGLVRVIKNELPPITIQDMLNHLGLNPRDTTEMYVNSRERNRMDRIQLGDLLSFSRNRYILNNELYMAILNENP